MLKEILEASNLFITLAVDFYKANKQNSIGGESVMNSERMYIAANVAAKWAAETGNTVTITHDDLISACKRAGWVVDAEETNNA